MCKTSARVRFGNSDSTPASYFAHEGSAVRRRYAGILECKWFRKGSVRKRDSSPPVCGPAFRRKFVTGTSGQDRYQLPP
jgi:hypothetical protein